MPDDEKRMNFLEQFISKHYLKQPKSVRTVTFVLFTLLFVYSTYRLIGGEFTVNGRMLQKVEGGFKPAKNYDVQVGDKFFGTNSRGFYYIVLSPQQYYRVVMKGELTLGITKDEIIFPSVRANFQRLDQAFEDISLPPLQQVSQLRGQEKLEDQEFDFLVTPAWANPVQGGDRLFIQAVEMKPGLSWIKEGAFEFQFNNNIQKLTVAQAREGPAGLIPLVSGEKVLLGTDYHFKLPERLPSALSGKITLSASKGYFSSYAETFRVPSNQTYGVSFTALGDQGSKLQLLLLLPYDLKTFDKKDVAHVKDKLASEFAQKGFRVLELRSPLGYEAQTNALFGGKQVPFTALQAVLRILAKHMIKIKTVQYRLDLKSGNPYEIQLGSSAAFDQAPPIPANRLQRLLTASTGEQFKGGL